MASAASKLKGNGALPLLAVGALAAFAYLNRDKIAAALGAGGLSGSTGSLGTPESAGSGGYSNYYGQGADGLGNTAPVDTSQYPTDQTTPVTPTDDAPVEPVGPTGGPDFKAAPEPSYLDRLFSAATSPENVGFIASIAAVEGGRRIYSDFKGKEAAKQPDVRERANAKNAESTRDAYDQKVKSGLNEKAPQLEAKTPQEKTAARIEAKADRKVADLEIRAAKAEAFKGPAGSKTAAAERVVEPFRVGNPKASPIGKAIRTGGAALLALGIASATIEEARGNKPVLEAAASAVYRGSGAEAAVTAAGEVAKDPTVLVKAPIAAAQNAPDFLNWFYQGLLGKPLKDIGDVAGINPPSSQPARVGNQPAAKPQPGQPVRTTAVVRSKPKPVSAAQATAANVSGGSSASAGGAKSGYALTGIVTNPQYVPAPVNPATTRQQGNITWISVPSRR